MMSYELGQVVKSCAGRDQGQNFVVIEINEDYVYLVDGQSRRLEKPKKKKKKHIQITHELDELIALRLKHGEKISNADIRKSLMNYEQKAN